MRVIFLILFVISAGMGIFSSVDAIFYTPELFNLAQDYDIIYPYYALLGFLFWGGLALFYTLVRRNEWGYGFSLTWVWINISYLLLITVALVSDTTFTMRYLMASTPLADRNIGGIAELVGSGFFSFGMILVSIGFTLFGFVYLWILIKNRDYFWNTSSI